MCILAHLYVSVCWNEEILKSLCGLKRYSEVNVDPEETKKAGNAIQSPGWFKAAQEEMSKIDKESGALIGLLYKAHTKIVADPSKFFIFVDLVVSLCSNKCVACS